MGGRGSYIRIRGIRIYSIQSKEAKRKDISMMEEKAINMDEAVKNAKPGMIDKKLYEFLLNTDRKHYNEFASIGYSINNAEQLREDILRGYEINKKIDIRLTPKNNIVFSVGMDIGVSKKRTFRTVWQIDEGKTDARFISAYRTDWKKMK